MRDTTELEAPTAETGKPAASGENPKRVVVSPDQLLRALEGRLNQAAEKAVTAAAASHLQTRVNDAVTAVESFNKSSIRQFEEQCAKIREDLIASASAEAIARVQAETASAEKRMQEQLAALAQAQETAQQLEKSAGETRLVLAEAVDFLQATMTQLKEEFAAQLREAAGQTSKEATEGLQSSLAALATETQEGVRPALTKMATEACLAAEARQSACLEELTASSNRVVDEFRQQMEAIVTAAAGAMSAAHEQTRNALDSLAQETAARVREAGRSK